MKVSQFNVTIHYLAPDGTAETQFQRVDASRQANGQTTGAVAVFFSVDNVTLQSVLVDPQAPTGEAVEVSLH